jgi:hypothetical protein
VTNTADRLIQDIEIVAWLFMSEASRFKVPGDELLPNPHFLSPPLQSLMTGETAAVPAYRSMQATKDRTIPLFSPNAVPVVKIRMQYVNGDSQVTTERSVLLGSPRGHDILSYEQG